MMTNLIGLVGFARSGKNSFSDFFIENINKNSEPRRCFKPTSFAYPIRQELDSLLTEKLGISAFTEDPKEKEIIRPLLVCWGTQIMREQVDKNYWIKAIEKTIEINRKNNICSIITDVRFENEILWLKKKGGTSLFIEREGVGPKNADELECTSPLKTKCDLVFSWPTLSNFKTQGKRLVKEFLINNNLCPLTLPTKN
jgi:hypothetical protein